MSRKTRTKQRGTWLTIALVIIILHGLAAAIYYYIAAQDVADLNRPVALTLMSAHFLANVAAAFGIWHWKKWGLYLYAGSTIVAVIIGLLSVGIWSLFYLALPFVILGWLLRTKWDNFS